MGYTKDAIKGVSWLAVLRGSTRVISFLKTIILARILLPAQFGTYGVALLVLGFLEVMTETGVNIILIQEKDTDKYINSAWLVSIIRGIIIASVIILVIPFIVNFFHSPEAAQLLYTISIVPFLRGFINPSVVKFQKELNFSYEFWYRFSIFLIDSIVAIIFTLYTHNPIGIIFGLIAGVLFEVILSYRIVKPVPYFNFNKEYVMKIIHRGKWITASGIFNYLFHNADNIVVGKLMGTSSLGIYQIAYSLSILPITEIADVFSKVTFPVFIKISGDKDRLKTAFYKTLLMVTCLTIPLCLILIFFPEQIITVVLGSQWLSAVSILPLLAVFGALRGISGTTSALFLSVGKQEYVTVVTLVSIIGLIIPIIPLVIRYGMIGAAISALIGTIAALPVMVYYTWKVFNSSNEKSRS